MLEAVCDESKHLVGSVQETVVEIELKEEVGAEYIFGVFLNTYSDWFI